MKFIAKRIGDGAEIEGYVLRCDGNINQGMTYICPEVRQGNIVGLKGNLAEMSFGPFYAVDPKSIRPAPSREKIHAKLEALKKEAEKYGAELQVMDDDFIDDDHLDCLWYGGCIGSIVYKGYEISIEVHGEVAIYGDPGDEEFCDLTYVNKQGTGAYNMGASDTLRTTFKNDAELRAALHENRLVVENNNWVEFFVLTPDGVWHDGDVIDDDVLDAFDDIGAWIQLLHDDYGVELPKKEDA